MSKIKKILAVVLTLAMVLAMSVTSFAADTTEETPATEPQTSAEAQTSTGRAVVNGSARITINGLAQGVTTTVKVYKVAVLNENTSLWDISEWAKNYVTVTNGNATFNWDGLKGATETTTETTTVAAYTTVQVAETSTQIDVNEIGAYLIVASDTKATYSAMGTATYAYDTSTGLIKADNKTVNAKSSGFEVTKTAGDGFVAKGENVEFTITSTFPTWQDTDTTRLYQITDTPTGLDIDTNSIEVKVGNSTVTNPDTNTDTDTNAKYTITKNSATGAVTIAFTSDYIGTENAHAGQTVEVKLTAEVTAYDGYSNTANAMKNDEGQDSTPPTVTGYTGDITITKYADNQTRDDQGNVTQEATELTGAEYQVHQNSENTALYFTKESDGIYILAKSTDNGANQTIVATGSTVQIKGLGEGSYKFVETKAPAGYSINSDGVTVEITAAEAAAATASISKTGKLTDTKLSALPSTGGIGTTIFTVVGCLIMIAAAAMFFVSRRKTEK
jgi:LPXTG-motif cell wall-anchored protein